jgi:hypothetical protein
MSGPSDVVTNDHHVFPIHEYPTIQRLLSVKPMTPIIGFVFVAGWCPDCAPVFPVVAAIMNLVRKQQENQCDHQQQQQQQQQGQQAKSASSQFGPSAIELVYVSSDHTKEEMDRLCPSNMCCIPFNDDDDGTIDPSSGTTTTTTTTTTTLPLHLERNRLKRYFHTCAGKEKDILQMTNPYDRQSGIPTIILLDTYRQQIFFRDNDAVHLKSILMNTVSSVDIAAETIVKTWQAAYTKYQQLQQKQQ